VSSTRVCLRCGWFAFERERCRECSGPCVEWRSAARACGVGSLFELLHVSPETRAGHFRRRLVELRARVAVDRQGVRVGT
jgi:hypothetical protein